MLKFNGRPDGLGNRIEELINLECYCIQNDTSCNYYWNNEIVNMWNYPILLKCKNIVIQSKDRHIKNSFSSEELKDKYIYNKYLLYSKENHIKAAKNISYYNDITCDISFISLHIRGTDKLKNRGKDEFEIDFFKDKIHKTINYLNNSPEEINIYITSDDINIKNYVIEKLNKNYKIVDPLSKQIDFVNKCAGNYNGEENIDPIFKDYFSLVHSKKIIMVPKFSSFAATASLLGNNILVSHCDENETSLYRYRCNIEYIDNIKT